MKGNMMLPSKYEALFRNFKLIKVNLVVSQLIVDLSLREHDLHLGMVGSHDLAIRTDLIKINERDVNMTPR